MTNQIPFNVDDFLLTDPRDVDFDELEDDQLFALIAEYGATNPLVASFALSALVARARKSEDLKARTVRVLAAILQNKRVDEDFFGSALTCLYQLDRQRGQAEIVRVIDACDHYTVAGAADVLAYDIGLYKGEPAFDEAVAKVAACLKRECQNDHLLRDDELYFLRNAGYPVIPVSDRDDQDRDIGVFKACDVHGHFVGSVVKRVSNGTDSIRVQPLQKKGSKLMVRYEIVELGISHARARQLIHQHVLVELHKDEFRSKVREVSYHDVALNTAVLRAYDSP